MFKINILKKRSIAKIKNKQYDLVICAGTSSKIWLAKKNPKLDFNKITYLINSLKKINAKKFVLISTCEIYGSHNNQKESSLKFSNKNYHYGYNRLMLENFVKANFAKSFILRLPIVYGKNFYKNKFIIRIRLWSKYFMHLRFHLYYLLFTTQHAILNRHTTLQNTCNRHNR